jgi:hypothetical protein
MKRCIWGSISIVTCVTVLLALSGAAVAGESAEAAPPWVSSRMALRSSDRHESVQSAAPAGTGVIKGTVLDYDGLPAPDAYVAVWFGDYAGDGVRAESTGSYEITDVPAVSGTGELWMWPGKPGDPLYISRGLTFLDPGPNIFDFWPGRLPLTIQRGGPWAKWSTASVSLYGAGETSPDLETYQDVTVGSADVFNGYADALPGDYTSTVVDFQGGGLPARRTEALEIQLPQETPAVVQSGQTGELSLIADERDAARARLTRWASGAPGRKVILRFSNLQSGDVYEITGESMNGREPAKSFGTLTVPSPAPAAISVPVRVPLRIPTGDKYNFTAARVGGHLQLVASYQVCAFEATRHSIPRGEGVRLKGRVPIIPGPRFDNHMTLTLFARPGIVGQPWTWQAKRWTKLMTIRTSFDRDGRFWTPYLHPRRTTSYVIRYSRSFDPSWRAFTSVETVRVS